MSGRRLASFTGLCDFDRGTMDESRTAAQPLQLYRFPNPERTAAAAPSDHDCVVALKALAEDTRVRIVSLLIDAPLDVTEIADRVGISQYNASKHLRVLREAGLLRLQKSGRRHLYALTEGIARRMAEGGVLDLGCCSFQFERISASARPAVTHSPSHHNTSLPAERLHRATRSHSSWGRSRAARGPGRQ